MLVHQNHGARGENGSIMVVVFVCLCLASKKPSEREFFVPARTDLGVKLLIDNDNIIHSRTTQNPKIEFVELVSYLITRIP
jgi:hypothetical protein